MSIVLICFFSLGMAWIMEHVFGIQACQLCYYERYVYGAVGIVALSGLFLKKPQFLIITGLIFFFGMGLSFYHVGIQNGWFELPSFCQTAQFDSNASLEDLRAQLLGTPTITCNLVSWSLFGISLAGYNFIVSLGLSLFSFLGFWKSR
ncbi:disulfide bond formation protein B [Candidatus Bealeia paramacronuclearis]|uniref:disulfide bond formation protein B n=1 Tax=Candidatus Bealeia paramacronuclearis TaxID=1921001 RepID=UPI002F2636E5